MILGNRPHISVRESVGNGQMGEANIRRRTWLRKRVSQRDPKRLSVISRDVGNPSAFYLLLILLRTPDHQDQDQYCCEHDNDLDNGIPSHSSPLAWRIKC